MKVFFDSVNFSATHTGPNCFAHRLAVGLSKKGHILADPSDYDVGLVFIEKSPLLNLNRPFVHRLDGIWFKPQDIETKNKAIKETFDLAAEVIFQSDFDRKMAEKWFGPKERGTVIRNGIELTEADVSPDVEALKKKYSKIFVCSSNWHPSKRLKKNVELYLHLKKSMTESCCLIVLGSNPDYVLAGKDIFYTNASIPHEMCLQFYSVADWMIHLAWADHAPNVVVEALSQGCPVICSETGGTKELVGENGLVLKEDYDYAFEAFDYDDPPSVDVHQVQSLPSIQVDRSTVDISRVVDEYEKVLAKAAGSRAVPSLPPRGSDT